MVTLQVVPEAESQPFQPLKRERKPGVAVRVTTVPEAYEVEQVDPQLIWLALAGLGAEVTVPLPSKRAFLFTVTMDICLLTVAVTDLAAFIYTVHVAPPTESHPAPLVQV